MNNIEEKTTNKKELGGLGLFAVIIISAVILTGCSSGKLQAYEQSQSAQEENQEQIETDISEKESPQAEEKPTQAESESCYPLVAAAPDKGRIDLAMYSEGCYCLYNGSLYAYITEEGEEISPYIYEEASPFSEGLACVLLDGKYGFIGKNGETVLPFIYDEASPFVEGLAYFSIGEEYGFMDKEGNVIIKPDCDTVSSFQEGLAYFSVDGLYGYMDKTGRIVVEPVYDDAGCFQDGLAKVMKNGRLGIVGKDGTEILAPKYDNIWIEEDYITAEQDGKMYCFDREGRQCLADAWERIKVYEGMFCVGKGDKLGLIDGNGVMLLEPVYEEVLPIPERELIIVKSDGCYGVLDYEGNTRVPFVYSWISFEKGTAGCGLRAAYETADDESNKYGYWDGEDFSEIIPLSYDYLSSFVEGRAVVELDGKYGVIREDGTLAVPIQYDRVQLFSNGSMALWQGDMVNLYDCEGNLITTAMYDSICERGKGYEISKNKKYGLLDERGKVVVPIGYDYMSPYRVYGSEHIYTMTRYDSDIQDILVKTDEENGNLRGAFLRNQLTPRVEPYMEFARNEYMEFAQNNLEIGLWARRFNKLYRIGENGKLILYFYVEPYLSMNFPMSYSGFYTLREGRIEELATGYECGGSMRGDYVCFFYDTKEAECKLGVYGSWGGFGGYSYGGAVYDWQNDDAVLSASFYCTSQTGGNYSTEELLKDAGLFYDTEDKPFTEGNILEAERVTEYSVNNERTTIERYKEFYDRYRYFEALDMR